MPIDYPWSEVKPLLSVASTHHIAGVNFGNLTKDRENPAVHPDDREKWKTRAGNLSGKPTWDRSTALIQKTRQTFKTRFTIIGTGGIFTVTDAREKIRAGADLVSLITGMIYEGPQRVGEIAQALQQER